MEVSDKLHWFTPGKSQWYPLGRKLDGPLSQSGCSDKEENSLPLPGIKPQLSSL